MLVEQAALAAAIDALRDLHLPQLDNPYWRPAPDGIFLPRRAPPAGPPAAMLLAGYAAALRGGAHLDEVVVLAGLHDPGW